MTRNAETPDTPVADEPRSAAEATPSAGMRATQNGPLAELGLVAAGLGLVIYLIAFVADRPGHDRRYAIDPSKIERELGWRARESFETGLAKTIDWYLAREDWWRPIRDGSYAGARLGTAG